MTWPALLRRTLAAVLVACGAILAIPGGASAHTDFDYSLPTDGASVGEPVGEIIVAFTTPVTLVGNGFIVLDPQNNEVEPFPVTDDDMVFRLQLDPPLAGGTVAVKYEVRSEDGHVVTGNFVFFVDAPAPTTTANTTPATSQPSPATTVPTTAPPVTTAPATRPATTTSAAPPEESVDETVVAVPVAAEVTDDDEGDDALSLVLIIAAALVVGVGGVFLVRSRTSSE